MKSNGKGIYMHEIDYIAYLEIGKIKFDFRLILKNGNEIKVRRRFGLKVLDLLNESEEKKC